MSRDGGCIVLGMLLGGGWGFFSLGLGADGVVQLLLYTGAGVALGALIAALFGRRFWDALLELLH